MCTLNTSKQKYTIKTILGYFSLGVLVFVLGICYNFSNEALANLKNTSSILILMLFASFLFYQLFFAIRNYNEVNSRILGQNLDPNQKEILDKKNRKRIRIRVITYTGLLFFMMFFLLILNLSLVKVIFFSSYCILLLIAIWFYYLLYYKSKTDSFSRLSYFILYPTILLIGVNFYYGLSFASLLNEASYVSYIPVVFFVMFFSLTAIVEFASYKIKNKTSNCDNQNEEYALTNDDNEKKISEKFSTNGFVLTSVILLMIAIIFFYLSIQNNNTSKESFANLLFSIAFALYLGIFEGWDALTKMNLDRDDILYKRHYRWWNFLQICYPLSFFFINSIVDSTIFTFGLLILFTLISIASMIAWQYINTKPINQNNKIRKITPQKLKIIFGCITILGVFINKFLFINGVLPLEKVLDDICLDNINLELIIFLFGAVSSIFIFLDIGNKNDLKNAILNSTPLGIPSKETNFEQYYRYGYMYDFTNYIYLIYLLVVHILSFGTNLIPTNKENEKITTIMILLIISTYMYCSFKAKFIHKKS